MKKEVLIIGAGKIGRGFVAHLFFRSGYKIWLLDASDEMISQLKKDKQYRVDLAAEHEDKTEYIQIEDAFTLSDTVQVEQIISGIEIIVSSVGASNIQHVAAYIRERLLTIKRTEALNWIICENAYYPADTIRRELLKAADFSFRQFVESKLGLVETQVLRTGMNAHAEVLIKEPTALRMQDWWTLPLDKDAYIGPIPNVMGFSPRSNFSNELVRKLYTFNGVNGPIAYLGYANGFTVLHEAALAFPEFFKEIQEESAHGLVHEFALDENEQRVFMGQAIKKYTDPALKDAIERNAADTKRKLSLHERLVGPACLCLKHGRTPFAYAKAIAAAYHYDGSRDAGTREVLDLVAANGIEYAIHKISGLDQSSPLFHLVVDSYTKKDFLFPYKP